MGNCLDRSPSETEEAASTAAVDQSHRSQRRSSNSHRSRRSHHRSSNHYTRLNASGSSLGLNSSSASISLNGSLQRINQDINHNYLQATSIGSFQSTNGASIFTPSSSSLPDSLQQVRTSSFNTSSSLTQEIDQTNGFMQQQQQVFYLNPSVQRTADQLTEEEQIKLLKRMALIQQLPSGTYDENKKHKECVICMIDFEVKDQIKCLPCMHTFHQSCIDSWLVRSLICPSCMEPVDAGLLSAFEN